MSLSKWVLPIAAIILGLVLISGRIDINLQHNLHLPKQMVNEPIIETHMGVFGIANIYDVYIPVVFNHEMSLVSIKQLVNNASVLDTVRFHIAGDGGGVDMVLGLINAVKATKAHTVMIVERPSYSGAAFLAVSGDELIMRPFTYLMFHTSSAMNVNCADQKGMDRAETADAVCKKMISNHMWNLEKLIDSFIKVSAEEKAAIKAGFTVVIPAEVLDKR